MMMAQCVAPETNYDNRVVDEYKKIINRVKSSVPKRSTIFVSTIPKRKNPMHDARAKRVNSFLRDVGTNDNRVHVVENNNIQLNDLTNDGIHLNTSGKQKLGSNIKSQLHRWIRAQELPPFVLNNRQDFPNLQRGSANR